MKKCIKIISIMIVIVCSMYLYKTYSTAVCAHSRATSQVITPATCTSTGTIKYTCPDCKDANGNNTTWTETIPKDPNNHTGQAVETMKRKATCVSYAIWQYRYKCCKAWTGGEYSKEQGNTWYSEIDENGEYIGKKYQYNGNTYTYGYDYDNHSGERNGNIYYGYEDVNGTTYKFKYTPYKCTLCGKEYTLKSRVRKATEEEIQENDDTAQGMQNIQSSITKLTGSWDKTAHYNWAHIDNYTGMREFLPAIYRKS